MRPAIFTSVLTITNAAGGTAGYDALNIFGKLNDNALNSNGLGGE